MVLKGYRVHLGEKWQVWRWRWISAWRLLIYHKFLFCPQSYWSVKRLFALQPWTLLCVILCVTGLSFQLPFDSWKWVAASFYGKGDASEGKNAALGSDGYYLSCISLQDKMPQLSRVTTTTQSNSRHLQKQAQEEMQWEVFSKEMWLGSRCLFVKGGREILFLGVMCAPASPVCVFCIKGAQSIILRVSLAEPGSLCLKIAALMWYAISLWESSY